MKTENGHAPDMKKTLTLDHPAIQKLHKAGPDIGIFNHAEKFRAIGGKEDEELRREDTEKNWDGGVTTYG
jgi:hypothetical protein